MGLFENFPYANFHELNLDWILHELKELETEITNFVAINSVKYANPITWDITRQYETNTVVLDSSGNAYLSVQPVPAGVALDREEYWTKIGNFSALWDSVRSAITPYDEQHNTTASVDHKAGDWVWLENDLLLITKNMTAGDKYVDGSNCQKTNVHDLFTTLGDNLQNEIADRETSDNALDAKITAEAVARAEADATLKEELKAAENIVFFEKYGAVGAGVTDDTAAIKAAVVDAENTGKILASLAKTYFVTDTIAIDCHKVKNVNITGTIKASFTDRTILKLYTSAPDAVTNAVINCKVDGTNGFGGYQFPAADEGFNFPSFTMKGIELVDINRSVINCAAANCAAGIVLTNSSANGVVFNTVNIGDIYNCVVSLSLEPANGGWVNSNTFVGGGFQIDSIYNAYNKRTVTIRLSGKNQHQINSNTFIAPSFETGGLPILFENASYNTMLYCRNENGTDYIAKVTDMSQANVVETLYGQTYSKILGDTAGNNIVKNAIANIVNNSVPIKIWNFDKNKCFNVGAQASPESSTIVDGMDLMDTKTTLKPAVYMNTEINNDFLTITGYECLGCLVDTSVAKTFYVSGNVGSRVYILTLDADKNVIKDAPYGFTFNSFWESGIRYTSNPSTKGDLMGVTFGEATKFAFIGYSGNVNNITILQQLSYGGTDLGVTSRVIRLTSDIGSRKIPNATIKSKCDTGTMLPACDPTGTALAYICTDGAAQTWAEIKKPT